MEAVIFLPLVLLAVLSMGYFMKVEGAWENAFYGAIDESTEACRKAYDGVSGLSVKQKIQKRIEDENPQLSNLKVSKVRCLYRDAFRQAYFSTDGSGRDETPLGFSRGLFLESKGEVLQHCGKETGEHLHAGEKLSAGKKGGILVWIFPHARGNDTIRKHVLMSRRTQKK